MEAIFSNIVKPSEISSEFEKLRRINPHQKGEKSSNSLVRATLSNVIFLISAEEEKFNADIDSLIVHLGKNHPSRFFIVSVDEKQNDAVQTKIVSRPIENASGQNIQSEELYISINPTALSRVPNLILSQLVPDIEIILVESENYGVLDGEKFLREKLLEVADIYVSRNSGTLLTDLRPINPKCSFRSWSYPTVSKWCSLISEQFNPAQVLDCLPDLNKVAIVVAANAINFEKVKSDKHLETGVASDLICFLSWILKSLNLQLSGLSKHKDSLIINCNATSDSCLKSPVEVTFKIDPNIATERGTSILGVKFEMGVGESMTQVECRYISESAVIEVANESAAHGLDIPKTDYCEFNVRRIPAHFYSSAEALLIAIRNQPIDCAV